jgi:hypothetical protein
VAALFLAFLVTLAGAADSFAQSRSYWLTNGSRTIGACPGRTNGEPLRAANGSSNWVLITAAITCRDVGDAYVFSVDYMSVQVNPGNRGNIDRDSINFDWLALAIYAPGGGGRTINWLYDEALPVDGALAKTSRDKIYFGKLNFPKVSKADIAKASNFTFYLTAEGVPFVFGLK